MATSALTVVASRTVASTVALVDGLATDATPFGAPAYGHVSIIIDSTV
jgi:hypothetical protein